MNSNGRNFKIAVRELDGETEALYDGRNSIDMKYNCRTVKKISTEQTDGKTMIVIDIR